MKDDQIKQILKELPVRILETTGSIDSFEYKQTIRGMSPFGLRVVFEVYADIQVISSVIQLSGYEQDGHLRFDPLPEGSVKRDIRFNFVYLFFEDEDILTEDQKGIVQNYLENEIIKFE